MKKFKKTSLALAFAGALSMFQPAPTYADGFPTFDILAVMQQMIDYMNQIEQYQQQLLDFQVLIEEQKEQMVPGSNKYFEAYKKLVEMKEKYEKITENCNKIIKKYNDLSDLIVTYEKVNDAYKVCQRGNICSIKDTKNFEELLKNSQVELAKHIYDSNTLNKKSIKTYDELSKNIEELQQKIEKASTPGETNSAQLSTLALILKIQQEQLNQTVQHNLYQDKKDILEFNNNEKYLRNEQIKSEISKRKYQDLGI